MQVTIDVEDIVSVNGRTKFEDMNCEECLEGMASHARHNGVIVDGLRRLSHLTNQGMFLNSLISDPLML